MARVKNHFHDENCAQAQDGPDGPGEDARLDRWNAGCSDGSRDAPLAAADAAYLQGYVHGRDCRIPAF